MSAARIEAAVPGGTHLNVTGRSAASSVAVDSRRASASMRRRRFGYGLVDEIVGPRDR